MHPVRDEVDAPRAAELVVLSAVDVGVVVEDGVVEVVEVVTGFGAVVATGLLEGVSMCDLERGRWHENDNVRRRHSGLRWGGGPDGYSRSGWGRGYSGCIDRAGGESVLVVAIASAVAIAVPVGRAEAKAAYDATELALLGTERCSSRYHEVEGWGQEG